MKTKLGKEVNPDTRGILYICDLKNSDKELKVIKELQFTDSYASLEAFANTPNPESQLATGITSKEFMSSLERLHNRMVNPKWMKMLRETI